MATKSARLTSIEAAISKIETELAGDGASSIQVGSKQFERATAILKDLYEERNRLDRQLSRANSNPVRVAKLGRARTTDR